MLKTVKKYLEYLQGKSEFSWENEMKNALEWLENSAEKYPDKIAYESNDKKYTFSEVRLYAQKIGSQIIKRKPSCY